MSQEKLERPHYALELLDTAHAALLRLQDLDAPRSITQALRIVDSERQHLLGALQVEESADLVLSWVNREP